MGAAFVLPYTRMGERFVRELFEGLLDGQVRFPMKVISGFRAFRRRKDGCMGAGRR